MNENRQINKKNNKVSKPVNRNEKMIGRKTSPIHQKGNTGHQNQTGGYSKQNNNRRSFTGFSKISESARKKQKEAAPSPMKVIPIGGLNEVGKNMTVFEYMNEIIIIDCGLKFPDDDMYGIDMVLPDFTYVVENAAKVKGLIITHGHEDHIGGVAYLLKRINVPIYATKLTMALIDHKLEEHNLISKADRHIITAGKSFKVGKFQLEPVRVNHSIADSLAFAIKTPSATVFHTGDFKIDFQPIDGEIIDMQRIAAIGSEGVDLLLADSTNIEEAGFTGSETTIGETFMRRFKGCKNRIIVTTFASNVHRIQKIIDAAVAFNRKVIIHGRSMETIVRVSSELGYLKIPGSVLIPIQEMRNYKPSQLVIITTGSQGEPMAALGRMANGEHKFITVTENDTIIISASPVPGNEKMVAEVINKLVALGAEVVYKKFEDVHVSGHAKREELKIMQTLVRPKNFMPVHGEARMLMHHGKLAETLGLDPKHIFVQSNGDVLSVTHKEVRVLEPVVSEDILVDGLGVGDIGNVVLSDRKRLSEDGLIIVAVSLHKGTVVSGPDITSRGFVYMRESEDLINDARDEVKKALADCARRRQMDWNSIRTAIRDTLSRFIQKETGRKPMILPILMEV